MMGVVIPCLEMCSERYGQVNLTRVKGVDIRLNLVIAQL